MAQEKVNLYLLAIVAIVAVVGIVVLVMNAGTTALSLSSDDLSGQAHTSAASKQSRSDIDLSCSPGYCRCSGRCVPYDIYGRCGC